MVKRSRSKRYLENKKKISEIKTSSLNEAIKTFKSNKTVKFDETLDVAVVLNKEKSKGEGLCRGYSKLPYGTGKKIKIAVFASGDKIDEAKKAGADVVGSDDLIKKVKEGKIKFDIAISPHLYLAPSFFEHSCFFSNASIPKNLIFSLFISILSPSIILAFP